MSFKSIIISTLFFTFIANDAVVIAQIPIWDLANFNSSVLKNNDTLYVTNYWATWCKPCVAELPAFEAQNIEFKSAPVKIILVSLDFKKDLQRTDDFVKKNSLQNQVALLSAGNPDIWIDKISPEWSGAIPATAFFKNGKLIHFHEGDFTNEQLNKLINQLKSK
jgi:thiol-disulfide isomerase/thioredoxin